MKKIFKIGTIRSAIYFTVAVLLFSLLVLFGNSEEEQILLDPHRILCMYPFCLLFSLANTLITYKNIEAVTKWLIHAVLTICGAFVFLILPAKLEASSSNFMGFALILFAYILGVIIYALVNRRIKSAIAEDRELTKNNKK